MILLSLEMVYISRTMAISHLLERFSWFIFLLLTTFRFPSHNVPWPWMWHFAQLFSRNSTNLCKLVAKFAKRLVTSIIPPDDLIAYNGCRLVALDKSPGVRPVDIGEVMRRISGRNRRLHQARYNNPWWKHAAWLGSEMRHRTCHTFAPPQFWWSRKRSSSTNWCQKRI